MKEKRITDKRIRKTSHEKSPISTGNRKRT